jgi:TM2 domain-containing membrane protein YozV
MRAPSVSAWFLVALCLGVSAEAEPADTIASPQAADIADRHPPTDSVTAPTPAATIPPATAFPVSATAVAVAPSPDSTKSPTSTAVVDGQAANPIPPATRGPPPEYRGHMMPTPGIPPPTEPVVAVPTPQPAEIDTPEDEDQALEIKLKTDPEAARRYRSPRKAFFLSLMVPGAGQIYVGSWIKATFFAATEIGLGVGWYEVVIVQAREKERQAEQYAAQHWRQQAYEQTWQKLYGDTSGGNDSQAVMSATAPNREAYCNALFGASSGTQNTEWNACADAPTVANGYYSSKFATQYSVGGVAPPPTDPSAWSQDSVLAFRSHNIKDLTAFYGLIGENEFATGWDDYTNTVTAQQVYEFSVAVANFGTNPDTVIVNPFGLTLEQQHYQALRERSNELARMQKWFLGGMILNHLAAAFDAALQASRMNRQLLQLQTSWLDHLGVQGGLAWTSTSATLQGQLDWSF